MNFVENIDKDRYIEFTNKHEKSHFLQSYEWGEYCKKAKGQIPHYVGLEDEHGALVVTALLLEKKTPLKHSYMYSPRGFLADYSNKAYLKVFIKFLKEYMKRNKIIYVKFDPDIKYQNIDEDANPVGEPLQKELYDFLISLGCIHKGFNRLYEGNQPRYTFRMDLHQSWDEINSKISKSFLKSVRRSEAYGLEIDNEPNVKEFYRLNLSNSSKDGFNPRSEEFYQTFTDAMASHIKYFNASFKPKEYLKKVEEDLFKLKEDLEKTNKGKEDIQNKINRLEKEKENFAGLDTDKVMVCSLICAYTDNRVWTFYIGSDELANLTFAVSRCYYEAMKDAKENNYDFIDLFGTSGDPHTEYKNLAKLHDFKRKFGGEYTEFIGEFDIVNNKFLYKVLPILLKIYRKIRG